MMFEIINILINYDNLTTIECKLNLDIFLAGLDLHFYNHDILSISI